MGEREKKGAQVKFTGATLALAACTVDEAFEMVAGYLRSNTSAEQHSAVIARIGQHPQARELFRRYVACCLELYGVAGTLQALGQRGLGKIDLNRIAYSKKNGGHEGWYLLPRDVSSVFVELDLDIPAIQDSNFRLAIARSGYYRDCVSSDRYWIQVVRSQARQEAALLDLATAALTAVVGIKVPGEALHICAASDDVVDEIVEIAYARFMRPPLRYPEQFSLEGRVLHGFEYDVLAPEVQQVIRRLHPDADRRTGRRHLSQAAMKLLVLGDFVHNEQERQRHEHRMRTQRSNHPQDRHHHRRRR